MMRYFLLYLLICFYSWFSSLGCRWFFLASFCVLHSLIVWLDITCKRIIEIEVRNMMIFFLAGYWYGTLR